MNADEVIREMEGDVAEVTVKNYAETIDCAIDLLNEKGWIKGNWVRGITWDGEGDAVGYCMVGALAHCFVDGNDAMVQNDGWGCIPVPVTTALERALGELYGTDYSRFEGPTNWNDKMDRTKEQVIEVMQKAKEFLPQ